MVCIKIAGSLSDDLESCMSDLQVEVERGLWDDEPGYKEWSDAFWNEAGFGNTVIVLNTRAGLEAMRKDVYYRWEFNQPTRNNVYGNEYPQASVRRAAQTALRRIDRALEQEG